MLKECQSFIDKKKEIDVVTYPQDITQCCLLVKLNYKLQYRQSVGFPESLFQLLGKSDFAIPDYTTLCRCPKALPAEISARLEKGGNLAMRIDSTGLKVYGEGEWKVCKHDCIDLVTQEILSVELTGNDEDNARVAKRMLQDKSENLDSLKAMGV